MDQTGPERLDEALTLKLLLVGIHRVRDVDGQHESEVHLCRLPAGRQQGQPNQQSEGRHEQAQRAIHGRLRN